MSTTKNYNNTNSGSVEIVSKSVSGVPMYETEKKKMVFIIHNFAELGEQRYETSICTCHGHQWVLLLHPWGYTEDEKNAGYVSFDLFALDLTKDLKASWKTGLNGFENSTVATSVFTSQGPCLASREYLKRSDLLAILGRSTSLNISIEMSIWKERKSIWRPENVLHGNLLKMYKNDQDKDLKFSFENGDSVSAHSSVIAIQCPSIMEMFEDMNTPKTIELKGINMDLFATLVCYLYLEELPESFDLEKDGLTLLSMANQFGCNALKMELEAEIIESDIIQVENAADILLLADSIACAQLKESALHFVVDRISQLVNTAGWKLLQESASLLSEVIALQVDSNIGDSVSQLRKRCADRGLEVDGTKEMLVKRCKK